MGIVGDNVAPTAGVLDVEETVGVLDVEATTGVLDAVVIVRDDVGTTRDVDVGVGTTGRDDVVPGRDNVVPGRDVGTTRDVVDVEVVDG